MHHQATLRVLAVTFLSLSVSMLVSTVPALAEQEWVEIQPGTPGLAPTVDVQHHGEELEILLEMPGFFTRQLELGGMQLSELTAPDCGVKGPVGSPAMPFRHLLLPVPNGPIVAGLAVTGDSRPVLQEVKVMPTQEPMTDDGGVAPDFTIDDEVYASDSWYPAELARVADDVVVRGQRFLMLEISPLQFNPARGEVIAYPSLQITLDLDGSVDERAEALKQQRATPFFPTLATGAADAHSVAANPTGIEYLIIAHDPLIPELDPLVAWKRLKGYTVEVVAMSTVGTTSTHLKTFLQTRYNTDTDLTWVVLVGDHEQVPSYDEGGLYSDLDYSCLDGGDYLPDIIISRISVQTTTDCANVIDKILTYDRNPIPGSWYGDVLVAALLQDYDDYNCTADRWFFETGTHVMHYIDDVVGMGITTAATSDSLSCNPYKWRGDSYPHRFTGYAGQSVPAADAAIITNGSTATQDVINAINSGVSIVQHRDHGSVSGWGDPSFGISHIDTLTNGTKTPVVFSINCQTGTFAGGECFAEHFMKHYPGGSVGIVAATANSYSGYNDLLTHGIYDCFWDGYDPSDGGNIYPHSFRPAEAMNYGKYYMYHWEGSGSLTELEFQLFHWHGDPEMMVYTAPPADPRVSHDQVIPMGATELSVTCPFDGALVAVSEEGVLLGRAIVSGGTATVTLDPAPTEPTQLDVVVTGHNLDPLESTCDVIVPVGPWLLHFSHTIDDSAGNGDGIANPGEAIVMPITVENVGADTGTGLGATLTSTSFYPIITDASATFPDIPADGTGQSTDHVGFTVGVATPHRQTIGFTVDWTATGGYSGSFTLSVPVCISLAISNIKVSQVTTDSALITWTTNVPATSQVSYGTSLPLSQVVSSSDLSTSHALLLEGLSSCSAYRFEVSSTSPGCDQVTDSNGGSYYQLTTARVEELLLDDAESGASGWTADTPWAITGETSYSPSNCWTDSPGGFYGYDVDASLTSPVIDLEYRTNAVLRFFHKYRLGNDHGMVEITTDGTTWTPLTSYTGDRTSWQEALIDLSGHVGSPTVQLRFRLTTDGAGLADGWHIDDIEITTVRSCAQGLVALDAAAYTCDDAITISVTDYDLDSDPGVQETSTLLITSDSEPAGESVILTEDGTSSMTFVGLITATSGAVGSDGLLSLGEGDLVTAIYDDADNGNGSPVTVTARANVDCSPPQISNLQLPRPNLAPDSALLTWSTDEPATAKASYGETVPPGTEVEETGLATAQAVQLTGLTACTPYSYSISSCDALEQCASDDNGGQYYSFTTPQELALRSDDFEGAAGWSHGGTGDEWQLGTPTSGPGAAHSGSGLYATNLSGLYSKGDSINADSWLMSPEIDLAGTEIAILSFWHWFDITTTTTGQTGNGMGDGAWLEVSSNGITWQVVTPIGGYNNTLDEEATYPFGPCWAGSSGGWQRVRVDLSAYTGETIRLRFRFFEDDNSGTAGYGWYIDDLVLARQVPCEPFPVHVDHTVDDSLGNAGGIADPGELVSLPLTLSNIGTVSALQLSGHLSTSTPGVLIGVADAAFPDLAAGIAGQSVTPFSLLIDRSLSCGAPVQLELTADFVDPLGNPGQVRSALTIFLGDTPPKTFVAILNHSGISDISYFSGFPRNTFTEYYSLLAGDPWDRFSLSIVTELDPAVLAAYDVLVLPDNGVPDASLADVNAWFTTGKMIVAADSAACYAAYSGLLWPASAGSNGYNTRWVTGASAAQRVVNEDLVTADYQLDEVVAAVAGGVQAHTSQLPGDAVTLLVDNESAAHANIVYRDVPGRGRIVLLGPMDVPPAGSEELVRDAVASLQPAACAATSEIYLDQEVYSCNGSLGVRVVDAGLDLDPGAADTITVEVSSDSELVPEQLLLVETGFSTGVLGGQLPISTSNLAGTLLVSAGDTITAVYHDLDAGGDGPQDFSAVATVAGGCGSLFADGFESGDSSAWSATIE